MLVIDGHTDSTEVLIALLEEYGVQTIEATCVSEALNIMQQTPPDLIISEIVLPDEDGYSLMGKVRALELAHNLHIPAIALTARATEDDRMQALTAGFCKHLSKPFNVDELIAAVASVTPPL